MKNTKKVLSVALAGALAFGSMGAAFAAAPEMNKDTDKKVAEAVERLNAFGIVNGMEDGKYHEEMKVTREQFAKILVEALGLGSAADAAKGSTKFSDVESSRWSAGYINVAQGQGLLSGYPDGTFQPAKEVSYAEAVTMLVRALGYKDEFLAGSWPGNYVSKAADAGITDGAKFADAAGKADRGVVALLVDNALDSKVVKVKEYEGDSVKFYESDTTLLEDKLEVKEYKNVRLVGNTRLDEKLDSDEARFAATKDDTDFVKNELDKNDKETVEVKDGLNTDELMGLKVKVYVNDDDEVIFMQKDGNETTSLDVVTDVASNDVELLVLDDTYDADGTAYVTGKEEKVVNGTVYSKVEKGMIGKFIVENNEIVFADVMKADVANGMIVTEVDTDTKEITGIIGKDDNETVNLDDDFDKFIIRDVNGKALELKDIKANNVVYAAKTKIDGDDYAIVTVVQNNEIKGKLTKTKDDRIEIADKEYKLTKDYSDAAEPVVTAFSLNKGDDIYRYADEYDTTNSKLEDADEEEVVAVTDIAGRVIYLSTDAKSTSDDLYAVVTKAYADGDKIKVYVPSLDKELTYTFEDDDDFKKLTKVSNVTVAGDFIKISLNKDGEIAEGELTVATTLVDIASGDYGKDSIKTVADGTLSVSKDSILISEEDATTVNTITADKDELSLVKWENLKEDTVEANTKAYVFKDSKDEIEAMLFLDGKAGTADDEEAAYVIDTWKKGEDRYVKVALKGGEVKDYELDGSLGDGTVSGDENGYVVKVKSDGELDIISTTGTDFTSVSGTVYDKDGDYIQLVSNGTYYKVNNDSVIYKEDEKKRLSNVTEGTVVDIILEDGKEARVIEIH